MSIRHGGRGRQSRRRGDRKGVIDCSKGPTDQIIDIDYGLRGYDLEVMDLFQLVGDPALSLQGVSGRRRPPSDPARLAARD